MPFRKKILDHVDQDVDWMCQKHIQVAVLPTRHQEIPIVFIYHAPQERAVLYLYVSPSKV